MTWTNEKHRRKFLRDNPSPPWKCYFCGDDIWIRGQKLESLNIHHLSKTRYVPTHQSCHNNYHNKENNPRRGVKLSKETKKKMSIANKGKKHSRVAKERMSTAQKGRKHSQATKDKISKANKAWWSKSK